MHIFKARKLRTCYEHFKLLKVKKASSKFECSYKKTCNVVSRNSPGGRMEKLLSIALRHSLLHSLMPAHAINK